MMSGEGMEEAGSAYGAEGPAVDYAILDQALWQKFRNAETPEEFIGTWLAMLCRRVPGATAALVTLGEPDVGPFSPFAFWPERGIVAESLSIISEKAVSQRQGAIMNAGTAANGLAVQQLAYPFLVDGSVYGGCAIAFVGQHGLVNDIMRRIQWATGWVEVLLRRRLHEEEENLRERSSLVFDVLATVLENRKFNAAAAALVTELALHLKCDPVSIGLVRRRRCRVAQISHAAGFGKKMNLVRDIRTAMEEAVDQRAIVLYPPNKAWEYRITRAHEELAKSNVGHCVLTVPMQSDHEIIGALTFQRPSDQPFDEAAIDLCDAVASVVGPVLKEKQQNDRNILIKLGESLVTQLRRLFGSNYFGRKLATALAIVAVAYFSFATMLHTVTSPAVVRGTIERTIVAPFRGYVASESARAGEVVRKGQTLARLDDQDLNLEHIRLMTTREQKLVEYDRALSKHDRAETLIVKSQIDEADAQLALIDEQLKRIRLVAPFDGYVVSGDLSQSIGAAVERGEELFKIAPLNSYRVMLEVDEDDIDEISVGQAGELRVAALPEVPMDYRIERITAISQQKDGRNYFSVEARLENSDDHLRPGMEGIAKTAIGERLQIVNYTAKLVDWARLKIWRWTPWGVDAGHRPRS